MGPLERRTSETDARTLDGWSVQASSGVDGDALARGLVALVPQVWAAPDSGALGSSLPAGAEVQRWRAWRAAFLLPSGGVLGTLHVKVYRPKDFVERLLEVFLPSRGGTSWRMGRALLAAGVPTPEPLLLAVNKPMRIHRGTVLVTRPLESPRLLTDEIKRRLAAGEPLRPLLADVARFAAAFHDAGFFHGDFTASNLLLAGAPGASSLWVIDLDRTKDFRSLPASTRRWLQCLDMRLLLLTTWGEVSRREWLRLLATYLRARKLPRDTRKRIARRVLAARRGRVRVGARTATLGGRDPWPT
jgi:tRNA A-37 threonylcarbamoyl transferase component Bud32